MIYELAGLYGEPSNQKVIKAGWIRWAGHVARVPDTYPAKLVFVIDPAGTRSTCVRSFFFFSLILLD